MAKTKGIQDKSMQDKKPSKTKGMAKTEGIQDRGHGQDHRRGAPNMGLQATANSLRSAPAIGGA